MPGAPARSLISIGWMDYTEPLWASSALLLIDVQQDFLDGGGLTIPGTTAVLPRLAELVTAFRAAGRPVVHVIRLSAPGSSDVDLPRRAAVEGGLSLAAPGTPGSQLSPVVLGERMAELDPAALLAGEPQYLDPEGSRAEVVLFKPRWGAFHRTGLDRLLRDWGVGTVVVAGCNLPNCPRATLFEASMRDLRTVLVTDAVSQASDERIADLAGIGVHLATTGQVLAATGGQAG
jgi:nicotinamidase-related amidase